jgi:transcriptional regulator with XRE-family HTH domain
MNIVNCFGDMVRKLREQRQLLQRQVASKLEIDTPMLSKIERGERRAKRKQVVLLAETLSADQEELVTLWLADKIYEVVKDESCALHALQVAKEEISYMKKRS